MDGRKRSRTCAVILNATLIVLLNAHVPSVNGFGTKPMVSSFRHLLASPGGLEGTTSKGPTIDDLFVFDDNDEDDDDDGNYAFDEQDDREEEEDDDSETSTGQQKKRIKSSRWDNLNPRVKAQIVKEAQERAIANKKKREPAQVQKRRMMMYFKEQQLKKKKESRVQRPLRFSDRTPLSTLLPGMEMSGVVISLTPFGAYVDVGTECDGLLHISQITREQFVQHPRQVLTPGDAVTVRVRSTNPDMRKLHLTMLPREMMEAEIRDAQDDEERIALDELQPDDELWGELKRVTDYGAYVEVGAEVDGFLHFMDHPAFGWSNGEHPSEYMQAGQRVRVWVADVDMERKRIKLTANRPQNLPGPRRAI